MKIVRLPDDLERFVVAHESLERRLLVVVITNSHLLNGSELRTSRRNRQFESYGGEMSYTITAGSDASP